MKDFREHRDQFYTISKEWQKLDIKEYISSFKKKKRNTGSLPKNKLKLTTRDLDSDQEYFCKSRNVVKSSQTQDLDSDNVVVNSDRMQNLLDSKQSDDASQQLNIRIEKSNTF